MRYIVATMRAVAAGIPADQYIIIDTQPPAGRLPVLCICSSSTVADSIAANLNANPI